MILTVSAPKHKLLTLVFKVFYIFMVKFDYEQEVRSTKLSGVNIICVNFKDYHTLKNKTQRNKGYHYNLHQGCCVSARLYLLVCSVKGINQILSLSQLSTLDGSGKLFQYNNMSQCVRICFLIFLFYCTPRHI